MADDSLTRLDLELAIRDLKRSIEDHTERIVEDLFSKIDEATAEVLKQLDEKHSTKRRKK